MTRALLLAEVALIGVALGMLGGMALERHLHRCPERPVTVEDFRR